MNKISSVYCYRDELHTSYLTYIQLATIIVFNGLVMAGNVIANTLVIDIYIDKNKTTVQCRI